MQTGIFFVILFYLISTTGYLVYLFIQKDYLQKTAYYILLSGFIFHSITLAYGYTKTGYLPAGNLNETLSIAGWAVAGVFLLLRYRFNLKILGVYAAPLALILLLTASRLPRVPAETTQIFKSFWLSFTL